MPSKESVRKKTEGISYQGSLKAAHHQPAGHLAQQTKRPIWAAYQRMSLAALLSFHASARRGSYANICVRSLIQVTARWDLAAAVDTVCSFRVAFLISSSAPAVPPARRNRTPTTRSRRACGNRPKTCARARMAATRHPGSKLSYPSTPRRAYRPRK